MKRYIVLFLLSLTFLNCYSQGRGSSQSNQNQTENSGPNLFDKLKETFNNKPGEANTPIKGSATENSSTNVAPSLEKCEKSLGTIAISEPQNDIQALLNYYKLPPPNQLLRLIIQQSKCFQVVERGKAMKNILQERALSDSGELQADQNIGKGQLISADFVMTATVAFSTDNSGGAAIGAIGSFFGPIGAIAGAVGAGMSFKQAQTSLVISDVRSGLQVAAAEGNVEKADFGIGGVLGGVGAGAYTSTAEGKIVAAALLDNYNNIVKAIRDLPVLANSKVNEKSAENAKSASKANTFVKGDMLRVKVANVLLLKNPDENSGVISKLSKTDDLLYLGVTEQGFVKVRSDNGIGWVEEILVKK